MSPGLPYYIIGFKFEGYRYQWRDDLNGFYSNVSQRVYKKIPDGAYNLEWMSSYRLNEILEEEEK